MEGGSFTVKWEPKAGKPDNGFDLDDGLYKHSKNATSNKIICDLGGNFELRRKNGKSLVVTFEFSGGEYEFLQAITKKNGKHLTIGLLREFDASVPDQLKYPETSVKVERVVLDNVQLVTGQAIPGNCTSSGDKIKCNTSSVTAPKVKIHVCTGTQQFCRGPA